MTVADYAHACLSCGYDSRVGEHQVIEHGSDDSHFVIRCRVPVGSAPVAFHRMQPVLTEQEVMDTYIRPAVQYLFDHDAQRVIDRRGES